MSSKASLTIVIADDDADDRMLVEDAFAESRLANPRVYVEDGEQLLQYLRGEGEFAQQQQPRRLPGLILLDLNMPRMDGRTVLKHIKDDPELRRVPVIVLTTSKAEEDILRTYDLGVSSFITKPVSFEGLVDVVRTLNHYWIEIVELPNAEAA
jgi:CheY-like chemotaxis protein